MLQETVLPWLEAKERQSGGRIVFQDDNAPVHRAKNGEGFLDRKLTGNVRLATLLAPI